MDDEIPPPPPVESGFRWWLALIPIVLLTLFLYRMVGRNAAAPDTEAEEAQAFNVDEVPETPKGRAAAPEPYVSQAEKDAQSRLGSAAGPGLSGFVPERDQIFFKDPKNKEDEANAKELAFVKKFDPLIRAEQERLNLITRRYRKKEAVVREVDMAFGKLPRYMDLRAQYGKDRNPYAFVRGAVALPEVRKAVYKFATSADVWRVSVGMMLEGLRQKPPKPVYDETKRFMTEDTKVAGFVTDLTAYMMPRVGTTIMPAIMRPGVDISPLKDLAKDLNVSGNMTDLSKARKAAERAGQQAPPR